MNGCRRAVDCIGKWDVSYTSTVPRTETIRIRIPHVVRGPPGGANVRNDRYHVLEIKQQQQQHTHTHTRLTTIFPGLPRSASTGKVKPIWILLKQETVSGSGISWAICKSALRSRQITTPAPHHSVFTGRMPFCHTTNSVKSLKANSNKAAYNSRFALTQSFKT